MISWNGTENLDDWKRRHTYNKNPLLFWMLMCKLGIYHNDLLIEFHTVHPKTKKNLGKNSYAVYECVYCLRRRSKE